MFKSVFNPPGNTTGELMNSGRVLCRSRPLDGSVRSLNGSYVILALSNGAIRFLE